MYLSGDRVCQKPCVPLISAKVGLRTPGLVLNLLPSQFGSGAARGRATGDKVDVKNKKDLAVDFINLIRTMEPAALNALIVKEAGEDLAQFFLSYSANLISKDPQRVLENTSSLMLMGYLIRTHEEKEQAATRSGFQAYAQA